MVKELGAKGTKKFPTPVRDMAADDEDELMAETVETIEFSAGAK